MKDEIVKAVKDKKIPMVIEQELIEFATYISNNFKNLDKEKFYYSKNEKYKVEIYETFTSLQAGGLKTPARVGQSTATIQLQRKKIEENYSKDFVFFIVIWCGVEFELLDLELSDLVSIEYYLTTGKSKENLYNDYVNMLGNNPIDSNLDRFNKVKKLLK